MLPSLLGPDEDEAMTPATTSPAGSVPTQALVHPPIARVAVMVGGSALVVGGACIAIALALHATSALAGAMALASVLVGVAVGLVPMAAMGPRPAFSFGSAVLFGSALRMISAFGLAVSAYIGLGLEGKGFWFVFLASALAALVSEVLAVTPVLRDSGKEAEQR